LDQTKEERFFFIIFIKMYIYQPFWYATSTFHNWIAMHKITSVRLHFLSVNILPWKCQIT